jgi:hypothetical protein
MADETIRFFQVPEESGLLAVADVTLFPGVSLRGWHILRRDHELVVLPPHQVYHDPETGEDTLFELLHFQDRNTRAVWLTRVKEEFLKWRKRTGESKP